MNVVLGFDFVDRGNVISDVKTKYAIFLIVVEFKIQSWLMRPNTLRSYW